MAGGLESTVRKWRKEGLGIVALTLMIDDPEGDKPTIEAARQWRQEHGIRSAYVAADWKRAMAIPGMYRTPLFTIVDPRTMRVVARIEGWRGRHPDELLALARKNRR